MVVVNVFKENVVLNGANVISKSVVLKMKTNPYYAASMCYIFGPN